MNRSFLLGFDIGGTKCAVILGRPAGDDLEVLEKVKFPTSECGGPYPCVERMAVAAEQLLAHAGVSVDEVAGCGVSCGGPLDSRNGVIQSPPNLPGWNDIPVVALLEKRFGQGNVHLQNDANAGAVAEWRYGAGRGAENLIFLTFGTGLGAGLILNGKLYSGTCDMAGECGHVRLEKFGPCGYGKAGSFEGFCSGGGIAQLAALRAREALQNNRPAAWCRSVAELDGISAKIVGDAADAGDELALAVYRECGEYLGRGLAMLIDILNPERIVIGSVFARSENLLRTAMEEVIAREALPASAAVCRVVPAGLGERIGDLAALSLAGGKF